jgi:muramoyltetrapeptide carboxypeptidase
MLRALRPGSAEGVLRGGCLSILAAAAGTPWALVLNEPTILFLEDIGEPAYRIDRLLMQLRHSDAFAQVAGVVLGEMQDCDGEGVDRDALDRIVLSALDGLDVPIAAGLPSGHTAGAGVTLPFNVRARLTCGDAAHLEILEHGVR